MAIPARLNTYVVNEKQLAFQKDFLAGWEDYETWDTARVGQSGPAMRTFKITDQDIVAYNKACGETDPLMIDPEYARKHSPTGELLQHPVFTTALVFYSVGESGIGSWVRTAGSRNPYERIEIVEPFAIGETITTTVTTVDKYMLRDKHYLQMLCEFRNEHGVLKARHFVTLIVPKTRADVSRFANA